MRRKYLLHEDHYIEAYCSCDGGPRQIGLSGGIEEASASEDPGLMGVFPPDQGFTPGEWAPEPQNINSRASHPFLKRAFCTVDWQDGEEVLQKEVGNQEPGERR